MLIACTALVAGCQTVGVTTGSVGAELLVVDRDSRPVAGAVISGTERGITDQNGTWHDSFKANCSWRRSASGTRTTVTSMGHVLVVSKDGMQPATVLIDFRRKYDGRVSLPDSKASIYRMVVLQPAKAP